MQREGREKGGWGGLVVNVVWTKKKRGKGRPRKVTRLPLCALIINAIFLLLWQLWFHLCPATVRALLIALWQHIALPTVPLLLQLSCDLQPPLTQVCWPCHQSVMEGWVTTHTYQMCPSPLSPHCPQRFSQVSVAATAFKAEWENRGQIVFETSACWQDLVNTFTGPVTHWRGAEEGWCCFEQHLKNWLIMSLVLG